MAKRKVEKKRAFIYCRTSDDAEEDDGVKVSIETQEETGKELAERHDYEVIDTFIDRNRSGRLYPTGFSIPDAEVEIYCNECGYSSKSRTRKAFGELLQRLSEVDIIIVRRADRLMRPLPLSKLDAHVLGILKSNNILIHSHDDNIIDPNNDEHIFIFKITSTIQSKYVADRRDETKVGIKRKRDNGELYFPPNFYGFRSAGHQKVERKPEEIEIVKQVYKDYLAGKGLNKIARELNARKVPVLSQIKEKEKREKANAEGKKFVKDKSNKTVFWEDSTIRAMLKRPQYAAFQYKSNDTEEVKVPVFEPPVVSYKMWQKVKEKLASNSRHHVGNSKSIHPLSGLLRCGNCGYNLHFSSTYDKIGGKKVKVGFYRCIKDAQTGGRTKCGKVSIKEKFPAGIRRQKKYVYANGLEECLYPLIYKGYINHLIAKHKKVGLDDEIADCMIQLQENELFKKKLTDKLKKNTINDKTFDTIIADYIRIGSELEEKLERLKKEANDISRIDVPSTLYSDYITHDISDKLKRELFRQAIDHIDVWRTHFTVYMKTGGDFTLKRIRQGRACLVPTWEIIELNKNSSRKKKIGSGIQKVTYKHTPINEDTEVHVMYRFDNDDPRKVIYGDENLIVVTEGKESLEK